MANQRSIKGLNHIIYREIKIFNVYGIEIDKWNRFTKLEKIVYWMLS